MEFHRVYERVSEDKAGNTNPSLPPPSPQKLYGISQPPPSSSSSPQKLYGILQPPLLATTCDFTEQTGLIGLKSMNKFPLEISYEGVKYSFTVQRQAPDVYTLSINGQVSKGYRSRSNIEGNENQ